MAIAIIVVCIIVGIYGSAFLISQMSDPFGRDRWPWQKP